MRIVGKYKIAIGVVVLAAAVTVLFQNCAKGKFIDPDTRHSAIAMGFCKECKDESGSGLACRVNTSSAFSSCNYESCAPGFQAQGKFCVLVVCTAGTQANCPVSHGEGSMTCKQGGLGYGACSATQCDNGYKLADNACVKVEDDDNQGNQGNPPVCTAGAHRDCSTDSTYGSETCNQGGTAYGACELGDCKPGYNKDGGTECVANTCQPTSVTSCTVGAAYGNHTCNSIGSGWGTCEIIGCQQGYTLKDGVCIVQTCAPSSKAVCDFNHGTGMKTCNSDGTNYGACALDGCETGYTLQNNQCVEQVCQPASTTTCVGQSGTGIKTCNSNGMGYGACTLTACDAKYKLKNGLCVDEDYCEAGETAACSHQNGTGLKTCNVNSHKLGPCFINACNPGYQLVSDNGNACQKIKNK